MTILRTGPPGIGGPVPFSEDFSQVPYQFSLPGFEGPLDLLLRLIEREKVDITTVSLVQITDQYLEHLRSQMPTDAVALADFVAIASRLLLLKSRRLLPQPASANPVEAEDEDSLVETLREYALYRQAAASFDQRTLTVGRLYPRIVAEPPQVDPPLRKVPVDQLAELMQDALSRFDEPEQAVALPRHLISVADKCEQMLSLLRASPVLSFFHVVGKCESRLEIVVCFFAILHLVREGRLGASQQEPFSDILLSLAPTAESLN